MMLRSGAKIARSAVQENLLQSHTELQCKPHSRQRVAMDILGPLPQTPRDNKYILVIGDYFTKWTEAYAIPNMEAETVANIFVNEFVARHGPPEFLHTDQGKNFESNLMKEVPASGREQNKDNSVPPPIRWDD